jgi:hypothetical protein
MNRGHELNQVLAEMRARGETAPARVEENLLREFRTIHRRRAAAAWLWKAAVVAVPLAVAAGSLFFSRPSPPPPPAAMREVTTEFFPLGFGSEWTNEGGRVVRVRMPRSTVVSLGFPVAAERMEERVTADLVVSFDGTARAVRFVRTVKEMR